MTDESHDNADAVARQHLLTGAFNAPIDRIEAHRIILRPGQTAFRHSHPGGVVGYVVDGEITFEIDGQPATTLHGGASSTNRRTPRLTGSIMRPTRQRRRSSRSTR